tara:strand:- start:344 stop:553 length:210 start_codon:yes stop_codon:yes gene_type:complete
MAVIKATCVLAICKTHLMRPVFNSPSLFRFPIKLGMTLKSCPFVSGQPAKKSSNLGINWSLNGIKKYYN